MISCFPRVRKLTCHVGTLSLGYWSQPRWLNGLMRSRVHSLWLLVDHCVLRNWDRILVRAVKGLISRAGMVPICPLQWQRDVKLQQTTTTTWVLRCPREDRFHCIYPRRAFLLYLRSGCSRGEDSVWDSYQTWGQFHFVNSNSNSNSTQFHLVNSNSNSTSNLSIPIPIPIPNRSIPIQFHLYIFL